MTRVISTLLAISALLYILVVIVTRIFMIVCIGVTTAVFVRLAFDAVSVYLKPSAGRTS